MGGEYEIISIFAGAIVIGFAVLKVGAAWKRGKRTIDVENLAWSEYKENVLMSRLAREQAYIELERAEERRAFEDQWMAQQRKEWEKENKEDS
jgi:hypothetical protein